MNNFYRNNLIRAAIILHFINESIDFDDNDDNDDIIFNDKNINDLRLIKYTETSPLLNKLNNYIYSDKRRLSYFYKDSIYDDVYYMYKNNLSDYYQMYSYTVKLYIDTDINWTLVQLYAKDPFKNRMTNEYTSFYKKYISHNTHIPITKSKPYIAKCNLKTTLLHCLLVDFFNKPPYIKKFVDNAVYITVPIEGLFPVSTNIITNTDFDQDTMKKYDMKCSTNIQFNNSTLWDNLNICNGDIVYRYNFNEKVVVSLDEIIEYLVKLTYTV